MSDMLIISPDCMSSSHNTLNAAYSKRGRPACTCPHTLALLEKERERQREANKRRRAANGQGEDIRRGQARVPRWQREVGHLPIDPECPARGHNTLSWARGGHSGREARCICSHAQKVLVQYREERRVREHHQRTAERKGPRSLPRIDWKDALCRRPENVKIADGGFDERKTWFGITARTKAKELCRACPLFDSGECARYIRRAEALPGELGGVYAGMDIYDRRGTPVMWVNGRWRSGAAA